MKKLSELTDRELALMMQSLLHWTAGKHDALVAEAAYRLVRAGGGPLLKEESELIDEIHTLEFRLREENRRQRRLKARHSGRCPLPAPGSGKPSSRSQVIPIRLKASIHAL
jgi:hypothetical protein